MSAVDLADEAWSEDQSPSRSLAGELLYGKDICNLPPPQPLVKGFLNLNSLAVAYGRPKCKKTFVALDLGLCVATGTWWHGHEIATGLVLYIVAEGAAGVGQRMEAWTDHQGYYSDPRGFVALPRAVNLLDYGAVAELVSVATDLMPSLIVVDTLNRCMPGTDEGPADMGRAVASLDSLRRATGACVLVIHHSGKDSTKGARGHSSLLGAVDTEIEVLNAGDGIVTVKTTAQKDMPEAPPLRLSLAPVADSLVVTDYRGSLVDTEALTTHGRMCMEVLHRIATDDGISTSIWRDACVDDGVGRSSFYAHLKRLEQLGEIENVGTARTQRWRASHGSE